MKHWILIVMIVFIGIVSSLYLYKTQDFDKILNTTKIDDSYKSYFKSQFENNLYVDVSFRVTTGKIPEVLKSLNVADFLLRDTMEHSQGYAYEWIIGSITIWGMEKIIANPYVEKINSNCCTSAL